MRESTQMLVYMPYIHVHTEVNKALKVSLNGMTSSGYFKKLAIATATVPALIMGLSKQRSLRRQCSAMQA